MSDPYKRHRRLGRWVISGREMAEYPGKLEDIQKSVVILGAQPSWSRDCHEFMGRSSDFDIVEEGDEIPTYRPDVTSVGVKWRRCG